MVWLFLALFVVGCEDLEDTIDDYAGDGRIRYIGKCSDLEIKPGWERLQVIWKGNLDATVKQVRVRWKSELDAQPFDTIVIPQDVLENPGLMDTISIEGLRDALYEVSVCNITEDGTESKPVSLAMRPYTKTHENLRVFPLGISNYFALKEANKLVVVTEGSNSDLKVAELHYWKKNGEEGVWNIKRHMDSYVMTGDRESMFMLDDVDFSDPKNKPLTIKRMGKITECIDEIDFAPDTLDVDQVIWSASFASLMNKYYGANWEHEVANLSELYVDYDLSTFNDLFYLPNLKKVILGKNRYMRVPEKGDDEGTGDNEDSEEENTTYSVTDTYTALMTLQYLHKVRGVTVERYSEHFLGKPVSEGYESDIYMLSTFTEMYYGEGLIDADLVEEKREENVDNMPRVNFLDPTGWEVTCSDTTFANYKKRCADLIDGDPMTYFEPGQKLATTVYQITIDMKQVQSVDGFKVVQPVEETKTSKRYLVPSLEVEVSRDGIRWEDATHEEGAITIGDNKGEISFIRVPDNLRNRGVRYIRISMASRYVDEIDDGNGGKLPSFRFRLADFLPYVE
jgi:F5/8 type C domain